MKQPLFQLKARAEFEKSSSFNSEWIKRNLLLFLLLSLTLLFAGCGGSSNGGTSTTEIEFTGNIFDSSPAYTCNDHLSAGYPGASYQLLCRQGYSVGYNYITKQANWVQFHITASSVSASVTRVDNFREDTEIPVEFRSTLSDYSGSGYDRGHMAPNATMDFNTTSMDESFLLSNITPQLPDFNRNAWADLEKYVRDCAVTKGELIVATGPLFNSQLPSIIGNGVAVPSGFYMTVIKPTSPATGFAVLLPHLAIANTQIKNYVTSIDDAELTTGLNFFEAVRDDVEFPIERYTSPICPLPWNVPIIAPPPPPPYGACGTKTVCGQMTSCAEAYYFLNTCGRTSLDADKDGVPCESICL